jgi:hypothetical protein
MTLVIPELADEPLDEPPADEERPPEKQPPAEQSPEQPPAADEERPPEEQPPAEQPPEQPPAADEERPPEEQPRVDGPVSERTGEGTEAPSSEGDVGTAAALPGTFTSQIIAIANLLTSGSPETPVLTLYPIGGGSDSVVSGVPSVYSGGVGFVTEDQIPTGQFAGVISSSFPAAAAVLTVNNSARTADAYAGINVPSQQLYGTLIFNKHANFESTLICQNTGGAATSITAELYKTGEASPRVTLTANNVETNNSVVWDIADNATVQSAWPGGAGEYGYAVFSSSNEIACVLDNQRMASPYVQSQFNGVPSSAYAGIDLRVPLVFNGHGSSSSNSKGLKWNTGISLVNINSAPADVSVTYTSGAYTNTCSKQIPGNGSDVWYAPEVGTGPDGWNCPSGPLQWSYPGGPTFGSLQVTSSVGILAIGNSNRYDSGEGLGAGYSSLGATPTGLTNKAVCPLAFNKDPGTDWISGIQVANVGSVATDITCKMVRANTDPSATGASVTITKSNVGPGDSATCYFPEEPTALPGFGGVVFVEATNASAVIVASSSNTNYSTLGSAALYDCINY